MNSPIVPSRPLTFGDLLDWTVRIYRARFGKLVLTTAIFLVPIGLVSGILNGQTMTSYLSIFLTAIQNPNAFPEQEFLNTMSNRQDALASLTCLLLPISLVASGMVSLALTYHVLSALRNQEVTILESVKVAWQRFWSWLGMSIVMMLAFAGLFIAILILFAICGFALALSFGSAASILGDIPTGGGGGVAAGIGAFCAIVCIYGLIFAAIFGPIAYFYGRWAAAIPGIVDQRWGAVESLQESWTLTRDYAWRATGFMILIYLFYSVIYIAIMALGFGLSAVVINTSTIASTIVFAVTGALLPVLWQPIQMAAHVMLYYDLRIRNESYDLEMQISQLEDEVAPDEPTAF